MLCFISIFPIAWFFGPSLIITKHISIFALCCAKFFLSVLRVAESIFPKMILHVHIHVHMHIHICFSFIVTGMPPLIFGVDGPSPWTLTGIIGSRAMEYRGIDSICDFWDYIMKEIQLLPGSTSLALTFETQTLYCEEALTTWRDQI